jgi:hypothetical protein
VSQSSGRPLPLGIARPDLINQHAPLHGSTLHRAVLRRNEELTRVLMQLGADARVGIWPHRDATTAYAIVRTNRRNRTIRVSLISRAPNCWYIASLQFERALNGCRMSEWP